MMYTIDPDLIDWAAVMDDQPHREHLIIYGTREKTIPNLIDSYVFIMVLASSFPSDNSRY